MTRVSLKEAYDNKDVVAQIYAIRNTAESAEDSAEQAVTTANTASDHVDALVPQVEGAVANANSASASAQASAQTVAGYENRLASVESDLNAITLRVTTAEGQIVTIQGRVTALETADGQNVKINRINDYAVGLTGNQDNIVGNKNFRTSCVLNRDHHTVMSSTYNGRGWHKIMRIRQTQNSMIHVVGISTGSQTPHNVKFEFINYTNAINPPLMLELSSDIENMVNVNNFAIVPVTVDGVLYFDYYINFLISSYSGLHITVDMKNRNIGTMTLSDSIITYYTDVAENPTEMSGVLYAVNGKGYAL